MDFGDRSDNPFSVSLHLAGRPKRASWKSAIRLMLVVCLSLTGVLVVQVQGKKYLVHRLIRDFDSLSRPEKKGRLLQILALGPAGIPALVSCMVDPDLEVGRTAFELLQQSQNNWLVLEAAERTDLHSLLVDSLKSIAMEMTEDRTGWATRLLQQTLMAAVERTGDESRELYRNANQALELYSLTGRRAGGNGAIASTDPDQLVETDSVNGHVPTRLAVRAQPLPVDRSPATELWTQWPPQLEQRFAETNAPERARGIIDRPTTNASEPGHADQPLPWVYRSGGKLHELDPSDTLSLEPLPARRETAFQPSVGDGSSGVRGVTHLVDSPLETYDDPSVMRWLSSEHAGFRDKAEAELRRRGYRSSEIVVASQLAGADVPTRLELIDAIAHWSDADPRPWLLILLEDPSRDVRLRVISVLATLDDPSIAQRLQTQLAQERDPTVAARIRRALKLR